MTILFVLENYYPRIGGVETLFKNLTDALTVRGHTCIVITTWPGGDVPRREETEHLKIIRIRTVSRYLFTLSAIIPILQHLRKCDLVHTTSYNAAFPTFIATRIIRRKVLITFHEVWGKLWFRLPVIGIVGKWGHYLFEQLILRMQFDRFVAVSQHTAERLKASGVDPGRISIIYPGIDYTLFAGGKTGETGKAGPSTLRQAQGKASSGAGATRKAVSPISPISPNPDPELVEGSPAFVYTFFGRLGMSKGLDILLTATLDIREKLPESRLQLILPTQPHFLYRWVTGFIEKHQLYDHIILRHHLPFEELKEAIRSSDCVVIPSYSEGFCFVAAESIALGTPVISSDQAALKEVIGGKFMRMRALDAAALVEAVLKANRGEWEEAPVKRFELGRTVSEYLEVYKELTPRPPLSGERGSPR